MNLAERKKKFRQGRLWCRLDVSGPVFVVFFLFIWIVLALFPPEYREIGVDLVKAPHAIDVPRANREDALIVVVARDGSIFLRTRRVKYEQLVTGLGDGIRAGAERKAYIKADQRAKYGAVVKAIDAVHDAGMTEIVFIAERSLQ